MTLNKFFIKYLSGRVESITRKSYLSVHMFLNIYFRSSASIPNLEDKSDNALTFLFFHNNKMLLMSLISGGHEKAR